MNKRRNERHNGVKNLTTRCLPFFDVQSCGCKTEISEASFQHDDIGHILKTIAEDEEYISVSASISL